VEVAVGEPRAGVVFDEAEEDFVVCPGRQVVDVMFLFVDDRNDAGTIANSNSSPVKKRVE
jgi:hypothetical protein